LKKVLIVHHRDVFSGAEKVVTDLYSLDSKKNLDITNFVPNNSELGRFYVNSNLNCIYSNNLISKEKHNIFYYFYKLFLLNFEILCSLNKFDVIIANTYISAIKIFPALLIIKLFKTKGICIIHDIFNQKHKLYSLKILSKTVNSMITVSNTTAKLNRLENLTNVHVIYNGISLMPLRTIKTITKNIVIVGLLDPWKGQANLVENSKYSKLFTTYLIGSTRNLDYVDQIKKLKINNVKIVGAKSNPWEYVNKINASFSICCSIKPDPLPTVVLESIANSIIPFVTSLGGGSEMIPPKYHRLLVVDFFSDADINKMVFEINNMSLKQYNIIINDLRMYLLKNFNSEMKREKYSKLLLA